MSDIPLKDKDEDGAVSTLSPEIRIESAFGNGLKSPKGSPGIPISIDNNLGEDMQAEEVNI